MNFYRIFFSLIFLTASFARGAVREVKSFSEITSEIKPGTLLVTDLDNTLIASTRMLGSDQWLESVTAHEGPEIAGRLWLKVQAHTAVRAVEAETPAWLRARQGAGIRTLGLTARIAGSIPQTLDQLKSVGYDLAGSAILPGNRVLSPNANPMLEVRLAAGVIFCGRNDKGRTLVSALRSPDIAEKFNRVVFVDDKKVNVDSVERALEKTEWEHVSFRYGAADPQVARFDARVAAIELENLDDALTDEAARQILESAPR